MARQVRPITILLDVLTARMDGRAVLTALEAGPDRAATPVIVLTMLDDRNLGYALGTADSLPRPVKREHLAAVLKRYRRGRPCGTVTIVDDDPVIRGQVRYVVAHKGCTVVTGANGQVAPDKLAKTSPDVLLVVPAYDDGLAMTGSCWSGAGSEWGASRASPSSPAPSCRCSTMVVATAAASTAGTPSVSAT